MFSQSNQKGESKLFNKEPKPIIVVTMATSRQGIGVVKSLSKSGKYNIRAMTRNPCSKRAKFLSKLPNVQLVQGDLLDRESLLKSSLF